MKFQVLQFDVRKHLVDGNFVNKDIERKHFDRTFYGKVDSKSFISDYNVVCEIEAADLDEVFEIGNIGPEAKITRIDRMHSVSIGDVIREADTGKCFVVAREGFTRLGDEVAA